MGGEEEGEEGEVVGRGDGWGSVGVGGLEGEGCLGMGWRVCWYKPMIIGEAAKKGRVEPQNRPPAEGERRRKGGQGAAPGGRRRPGVKLASRGASVVVLGSACPASTLSSEAPGLRR